MIELRIARASASTGGLLGGLLRERGVQVGPGGEAVVSYGVPLPNESRPTLNAHAGAVDKLDAFATFANVDLPIPFVTRLEQEATEALVERGISALYARKRHHRGGTDIVPVFDVQEIGWRKAAGWDFFVEVLHISREFRVWGYRNRLLGTYEKLMRYPERFRLCGTYRNWDNGFAFEFLRREDAPQGVVDLGLRAISALGLDFGATDLIDAGPTHGLRVLEVNSAPGVQEVRQGISSLADKITRWVALGYPKRKESQAQ